MILVIINSKISRILVIWALLHYRIMGDVGIEHRVVVWVAGGHLTQLYTILKKTRQLWQAVVLRSMHHFLIIFGKQHQHTFRNDIRVQLSLSLHFYL